MEKTAKYVVFRDKKTGQFLQEYKSRGALGCTSEFINDIEHATVMNFEAFEQQRKRVKALAKAFECEIVVVEATYDLKFLNGEDVKENERTEEKKREEEMRQLFGMLGGLF